MSKLYDFATKYMIAKVATISSMAKNGAKYIIVLLFIGYLSVEYTPSPSPNNLSIKRYWG